MMKLPEKTRKTLEKTVNELKTKENVYGVGLFGSWSRGEAEASSDVDLFIFDKGSFNHEFVERIESGGLLVDLDHVPKVWVSGPIPPEIDQKLFEMQVLYDRDWSLTNTKLLMVKLYGSAERVDIRTETHVVDSDIFLSRATSAFSREDFQSALLFAATAMETILKVLMEITLEPFSNSHFVERLERSTGRVGMRGLLTEYLETTGFNDATSDGVRNKLTLFKAVWDEIKAVSTQNVEAVRSSHFKVRTKLDYYLNPAFLQGTIIRAGAMIDSERAIEASHYLSNVLVDLVENYVWLKSSVDGVKVDYTTLMRSLQSLEEKNPRNYENVAKFLNLKEANEASASKAIEKARQTMVRIRRERKSLIKNHLLKA